MNKTLSHLSVITGSIVVLNLIIYSYSSSPLERELFAQSRSTISINQANALPLTTTEGNQVKVIINYSIGDKSVVGQRINAIMGIYDRETGSLLKLSSFPNGFIINNTEGTTQLATTLIDLNIKNISAIITLTNAEKSEKYSNDVRADLNLRTILPTTLPSLQENISPLPSEQSDEEEQENIPSNDEFNSEEE
ncbi:MAG: hypothetical protein WA461_09945 [Nitrososphaeraceae archaeon]